jgi:hypothetical protein
MQTPKRRRIGGGGGGDESAAFLEDLSETVAGLEGAVRSFGV